MAVEVERLVLQMSADVRRMEQGLARAGGATNRQLGQIERRFDRMNAHVRRSGDQMASDFRNSIAAIGIGVAIGQVIDYADAWTSAANKLAAAGVPMAKVAEVQAQLVDLAKQTRSDLGATVDLYSRLTRSTASLGVTMEEVYRATQIANEAFKAGGAAASEQKSAVLQLGQALGSGILGGDELRSIRENAPVLARAIADEFGVTIAQLKKLGEEGKLTSEKVFRAILKAGDAIDAQFAKTATTVGDAINNLRTSFIQYIGDQNNASGATRTLAGFINEAAENIGTLSDAAIVAAAVLGGTLAAGAIARLVGALLAMAGAMASATTAAGALGTALAFFSGPVGAAILAIGAALTIFSLKAAQARDAATETGKAVAELSKAVDLHRKALLAASTAQGAEVEIRKEDLKLTNEQVRARLSHAQALLAEAEAAEAALLASERLTNANRSGAGAFSRSGEIARLKKEIADAEGALAGEEAAARVQSLIAQRGRDLLNRFGLLKSQGSTKQSPSDPNAAERRKKFDEDLAGLATGFREIEQTYQRGLAEVARIEAEARKYGIEADTIFWEKREALAVDYLEARRRLAEEQFALPDFVGALSTDDSDLVRHVEKQVGIGPEFAEQEALRDRVRDAVAEGFKEGVRTDDWGQALRNVLAEAVGSALDKTLDRIADMLLDVLVGQKNSSNSGWIGAAVSVIGGAFTGNTGAVATGAGTGVGLGSLTSMPAAAAAEKMTIEVVLSEDLKASVDGKIARNNLQIMRELPSAIEGQVITARKNRRL